MTTNQAETKSDPQSLVGTTMTVLQGKHKGRTATILKLCPKRIKVTVDMPASHIAKGDVYLQPQALGLDRWYPNGLLLAPHTRAVPDFGSGADTGTCAGPSGTTKDRT